MLGPSEPRLQADVRLYPVAGQDLPFRLRPESSHSVQFCCFMRAASGSPRGDASQEGVFEGSGPPIFGAWSRLWQPGTGVDARYGPG